MNSTIEAFGTIDNGLITMDSTRIGVFRAFESTKGLRLRKNRVSLLYRKNCFFLLFRSFSHSFL